MPFAYDLVSRTMFAPAGGLRRLRTHALELAEVKPGDRVLELGCGTGGLTELLLARGAKVDAVDGSSAMIRRARKRAPGASFRQSSLEGLTVGGEYDLVLFAFVLHELPRALRIELMRMTLVRAGRLLILDHSVPQRGFGAKAWRRLLLTLEPPTVREIIASGYRAELEEAGWHVTAEHSLARATAALTIASVVPNAQSAVA